MTREQAQARAHELNREAAEGADHHWIAHRADADDWQVMRIAAQGMRFASDERHETTETRPGREAPEDTRPFLNRLIPPYGPN